MDRRSVLRAGFAAAIGHVASPFSANRLQSAVTDLASSVMSVSGPITVGQLGSMLPHEHVLVDFIGADKVSRDRYDRDEVIAVVLPQLRRLRAAGGQTLVECTPAYLGRDPWLLKRLSDESGVTIITNTGYYGARQGKFLAAHALEETADQLASRWLAEWHEGIEGSGIRPGLIKIGVDGGALTEVNRKLIQAAARTHLQSGLTIASHTGDGHSALEQLAVLREEGVAPAAWIWVHAQNEANREVHLRIGRQGAWVEFDGVGPDSIQEHVALVQSMREHQLLDRVLISQDAGWYSVGEPRGGQFRPYDTLFTVLLPAMKKAGFSDEEIERLTVTNPAKALAINIRSAPK
jgi:phosphotriesterase-related protein